MNTFYIVGLFFLLMLLFVILDAALAWWEEQKRESKRAEMRASVKAYLDQKYHSSDSAEELDALNRARWR